MVVFSVLDPQDLELMDLVEEVVKDIMAAAVAAADGIMTGTMAVTLVVEEVVIFIYGRLPRSKCNVNSPAEVIVTNTQHYLHNGNAEFILTLLLQRI